MEQVLNHNNVAGAENSNAPCLVGQILHNYFENSDEPMAVAYREQLAKAKGWHKSTDLCVDLKTFLRSNRIAELGKAYKGILAHDDESHYSFVETTSSEPHKRNPHVYEGNVFTVTRRNNGTYRPNLRDVTITDGFDVDEYADNVAREIRNGLKGLVTEG